MTRALILIIILSLVQSCSRNSDGIELSSSSSVEIIADIDISRDSFHFDRFTVDEKNKLVVLLSSRDGLYTMSLEKSDVLN